MIIKINIRITYAGEERPLGIMFLFTYIRSNIPKNTVSLHNCGRVDGALHSVVLFPHTKNLTAHSFSTQTFKWVLVIQEKNNSSNNQLYTHKV